MAIKKQWRKLAPKHQRYVAIGGALAAVFVVVSVFQGDDQRKEQTTRDETIRSVLTDKNTRDISIDSLSANMLRVQRESEDMKKEINRLTSELQRAAEQGTSTLGLNQQVEQLRLELSDVRKELAEQAALAQLAPEASDASEEGGEEGGAGEDGNTSTRAVQDAESSFIPAPRLSQQYKNAAEVFEQSPPPPAYTKNEATGERVPLKINSYTQPAAKVVEVEPESEIVYMPSGSILTGVLINGMDAPTGNGARKDPFPATLRLQKEAILPNHFQADVRECFMIVSGYGDLSTERAFLRGETISCIREDGGVIESRINSYVVGEDGKAGLRGRLVSKQGQIIAKSLMAGFMGGMANAFDVNPVPVLNTAPDGRTQYQRTFSGDMMQGAAMKGASSALDRVAKFYIDMAESMFPVVEVDAGRQVDVIVTGGVSLKLKEKGRG